MRSCRALSERVLFGAPFLRACRDERNRSRRIRGLKMTVNKKQAVVLWVALINGVVMGAFPPWIYTTDYSWGERSEKSERSAGYAFMGKPPQPVEGYFTSRLSEPNRKLGAGVRIDAALLAVQYVLLAIIAGGLLFTLKGKPSAGPLPQSRTYTNEELNAALRQAKAASKRKPPDDADDDDNDDPPSRSPAPASAVQREGASGTASAMDDHSRWRPRSLDSVGFRFDPYLWFLSLVGGAFVIFVNGHARLALDDAHGSARALGGLVGGTLPCFVFALVNSYIAWRVAPKSPNAPFWGGLCGIAFAVAGTIYVGSQSEKDRQQHESAVRWNAEYLAR
jgi:hypothetical protein